MSASASRIDEYARSMFAFDRPSPRWVASCAAYLDMVFGEKLKGAVFLDYAFGRGNWSLAALKAGAARVVAIDGSETNVRNFVAYCRENEIDNIDIICGNVLSDSITCVTSDILWIYGILPVVEQAGEFLRRLAKMRADDSAMALLYAYDAGSLRETVVMAARSGCFYESEQEFAEDSFLFTPAARLRVRDDLTAPFVAWHQQEELAELGRVNGYKAQRVIQDYTHWTTREQTGEFSPHHLVCGFSSPAASLPARLPRQQCHDIAIVGEFARMVLHRAPERLKKRIAIGLVNTHFSPPDRSIGSRLVQDFLFLMHAMARLGLMPNGLSIGQEVYEACMSAVAGKPRTLPDELVARSLIARYLLENTVRL